MGIVCLQIAQLCCTETQSAVMVSNFLSQLYEKEASQFSANAFSDGIFKALCFCDRESISSDAFANVFKFIAGNGKDSEILAVRQTLKLLLSRFEKSNLEAIGSLEEKNRINIAIIISRLPFVTFDGPLYALNYSFKIILSLVDAALQQLREICSGKKEKYANAEQHNQVEVVHLQSKCKNASILAQLFIFLVMKLKIRPERIKKFSLNIAILDKTLISSNKNDSDELVQEIQFSPQGLFETQWEPGSDNEQLKADCAQLAEMIDKIARLSSTEIFSGLEELEKLGNLGCKFAGADLGTKPMITHKHYVNKQRFGKINPKHAVRTLDDKQSKPLDRSGLKRKAQKESNLEDCSKSSEDDDSDT